MECVQWHRWSTGHWEAARLQEAQASWGRSVGCRGQGIMGNRHTQVAGFHGSAYSLGTVLTGSAAEVSGWSGITGGVKSVTLAGIHSCEGRQRSWYLGLCSETHWRWRSPAHVLGFSDAEGVPWVTLMPGILPLVPGTSIYNWVHTKYIIRSSRGKQ